MHIDETLIERCKKKERIAQEELYKKLYPYMMGICYRYTISKETSKEIVNTAMYKILMNIHLYDKQQSSFKTWISKITVNIILDEIRKKYRQQQYFQYVDEYSDSIAYADINATLQKFNVETIIELIESLNDMERSVFNLFCVDGYSHKEIAEMLQIHENTSKWYLNQAREKLKEKIKKHYFIKDEK